MNCEAVREMLWAYLEKETTVEETVKIEEHLKNCAACREELELQRELLDSLQCFSDEELPEGYHETLMQKLHAEAAPNVVPFPRKAGQKKKQPLWKQWGMVAAAALAVVAAGGVNGMLEMRESQNEAVRQMRVVDMAEDTDALHLSAESDEKAEIAYDTNEGAKMTERSEEKASAAGRNAKPVVVQEKETAAAAQTAQDTVMPQMLAETAEAEKQDGTSLYYARSGGMEVTDCVLLQVENAEAKAVIQDAITAAGGYEELTEENKIRAVILAEKFEDFTKALESIGALEWEQEGATVEGAVYRTVEIQLKTK